MAEKKKGIGDALIGLFVVREGDQADTAAEPQPSPAPSKTGDATVDDLISRYASGDGSGAGAAQAKRSRPPRSAPATAAPTVSTNTAAPAAASPAAPAVPEVEVDFPEVLRRYGLSDEEQARVSKALTLLHNLPAETPIEIKRQIVAASLQAFAIPVDQILESVLLHIGSYERYIKAGEVETTALLDQTQRRLAELEQEAARIRQVMQTQQAQQQGLVYACTRQKVRAQEVLDFFGPDAVEQVKKTSVKLRDRQDS